MAGRAKQEDQTPTSNNREQPAPGSRSAKSTKGIELLTAEYQRLRAEVEKKQKEVDDLRVKLPAIGSDDLWRESETIRNIERDRINAQARYAHFKKMADELKSKTRAELRKAIPTAAPDAAMDRYLSDLAKVEQNYAANVNDLGPEHPEIVKMREMMKTINKQIEDRLDGIQAGIDLQVAQCSAFVDELQKLLDVAKAEEAQRRESYAPYLKAKRSMESQERMLEAIYLRILMEKIDAELPAGKTKAEVK